MNLNITRQDIVSILFPLSIWLSSFDTFLPGLTIGDLFLAICIIVSLTYSREYDIGRSESKWLFECLVLQLLVTVFALLLSKEVIIDSVIKRVVKLCYYVIAVCILKSKFNTRTLIKTLKVMMYIAFFCIVLQYALYYVMGRTQNIIMIPFLNYSESSLRSAFNYVLRPSAYFLEPAHLSHFAFPIILVELYRNESTNGLVNAIVFSVACIMTTSGTAVFLIAIIWVTYFFIKSKDSVRTIFRNIILLVVFGVAIYISYIYVPQFKFAIDRLQDTDSIVYTGRLENGSYLIDGMNSIQRIIGNGFGNVDMTIYLTSYKYLFYCGGYISILIWMMFFIRIFVHDSVLGKFCVITFIALCISSRIFLSISLCYYLIFCIFDNKQTGIELYKQLAEDQEYSHSCE